MSAHASSSYPKVGEISQYISDDNFRKCIEELGINREIKSITKIDCRERDINNIDGIEHFRSLKHLIVGHNNIQSIPYLGKNTSLAYVYINNNKLSHIDFSGLHSLRWLKAYNNQIESVILDNHSLKSLDLSRNQLNQLDLRNVRELGALEASDNNLNSIQFSSSNKLRYLQLDKNEFTVFDTSNLPKLEDLNIEHNQVSSLLLTNNPKIKDINASKNQLKKLLISSCRELTTLSIKHNNSLSSISGLGLCEKIKEVKAEGIPIDCELALLMIDLAEKKHKTVFRTKHQC